MVELSKIERGELKGSSERRPATRRAGSSARRFAGWDAGAHAAFLIAAVAFSHGAAGVYWSMLALILARGGPDWPGGMISAGQPLDRKS